MPLSIPALVTKELPKLHQQFLQARNRFPYGEAVEYVNVHQEGIILRVHLLSERVELPQFKDRITAQVTLSSPNAQLEGAVARYFKGVGDATVNISYFSAAL